MIPEPLAACKYFGGKNALGHARLPQKINRLLPQPAMRDCRQTYIEPFAGMLGVLLNRRPAHREIINDLNSNVAAFWRIIRDHQAELADRLANTENGKEVFAEANAILASNDADDLRRAWAFLVATQTSIQGFRQSWQRPKPESGASFRNHRSIWERITAQPLADRMRNVSVENSDALDIIRRFAGQPDAVIYCDPPYEGIRTPYEAGIDYGLLAESITNAKAKIAISDYPNSRWDALGWERSEFEIISAASLRTVIECVWTNYQPAESEAYNQRSLLDK